MRTNRTDWVPHDPYYARSRHYIGTVLSQPCNEVAAKVNHAKRFSRIDARMSTKLLSRTVEQLVNYHTRRVLNQTKD